MRKGNFLQNARDTIEAKLPMSFSNLIYFFVIIYLLFVVGKTIWQNYQSNQSISAEQTRVAELQKELDYMQYQINYYQTKTFKEKEAREKLAMRGIGEKVVSLPLDQLKDNTDTSPTKEATVKTPNYRLWWSYFFGS